MENLEVEMEFEALVRSARACEDLLVLGRRRVREGERERIEGV